MARAAALGRLTWRAASVAAVREENAVSRTLVLRVPDWPGHDAGQHVDLRLTAPDGYTATRAYSIAAPADGDLVEVTVGLVPDGEVSTFLTREVAVGAELEVRGPLGGWFVWRAEQPGPVQLVAGGTGLVPLMAMMRERARADSRVPMRLLYSVRTPDDLLYAGELAHQRDDPRGVDVTIAYTRVPPPGDERRPGRVDRDLVDRVTFGPDLAPACFVCGPTPFVETLADLLVAAGHEPERVRTERFGPSGGP